MRKNLCIWHAIDEERCIKDVCLHVGCRGFTHILELETHLRMVQSAYYTRVNYNY